MKYLRAYVTPIKQHFDPIAMVVDNKEVVVAYGMATIDLLRLKTDLSNLNKCGLILVRKKNGRFRFAIFKEIIVGIFPGFKEVIEEVGLDCAYDFQIKDISKLNDYQQLSRWMTIKESERLDAENRERAISSIVVEESRLGAVLGLKAIEIIKDLMWATDVFEPLHAVTVLAKTGPLPINISLLRDNLRTIGADLHHGTLNRILVRRKSNVTIMDCAKFLFPRSNYFEVESSAISQILGMSITRLSSHFMGYLVVNDEYIGQLINACVQDE